jgi:hypothetical protein
MPFSVWLALSLPIALSLQTRSKYRVSAGTIHLADEQINQVIFIQLDKMKFSDGVEWKSNLDCALSEDLTEITCQRKKP